MSTLYLPQVALPGPLTMDLGHALLLCAQSECLAAFSGASLSPDFATPVIEVSLQFHGSLVPRSRARAFARWLRALFRHDWVVYSKPPLGGPEHVLRNLGAYTHRVAVSNSGPVALSEGNVTFRWGESAHDNKMRLITLDRHEFLRRFLLHLLSGLRTYPQLRHSR